ncbi:AAA family ATPase [Luedemannella flava]|uniref:AAA family ATPase n=1 Tax=Luedemannella flava TaxID=349316 RepID=UPI0031D562CB
MAATRPPYLLRLKAANFRSLREIEVHLQPLNVLVGPNGAGKSNLLDVIAFLGDSVRDDLEPALGRRGGFERVFFRGARSKGVKKIVIEIEAALTKNSSRKTTDHYTLSIRQGSVPARSGKRARTYLIREETFLFKRTAGPGRRISIAGGGVTFTTGEHEHKGSLREGSLGLATLPKLSAEEGGAQVEELALLFESFRVFDINVAAARKPSPTPRSENLKNDASNLAAFLRYIAEDHEDVFADIIKDARIFIPGLKSLEFESIGGAGEGTVLSLSEDGLDDTTQLSEASFGSIRALSLLALLHDPNPPKMTCIEEIDHGLHPHVLDRLVELLREASERTQFIIATHSPPLVNRLKPEELIVCERDGDASSRIPAIDSETVRKMEKELGGEIGLGELWFTGALGGVPS